MRSALAGPDATAYSIADNRTGDLSTFDDLALAKTLDSIKRTDEQLFAATGYDDGQYDALIKSIGDAELKANPVPPEEFPAKDESIETEHRCPKCGYEWSGDAAPGASS